MRLFSRLAPKIPPLTKFKSMVLAGAFLLAMGIPGAQVFPLIGQTWVFVNGPTEDTHIAQSISGFAASSVIVAQFNSNGTAEIRYVNLKGRFLRSTSEALEAVEQGLRSNVLRQSKLLQYSLRAIPDTSYSCDAELAWLSTTLRYNAYFINGVSVTPKRDAREWQWYFEPPECYASRPAIPQDKQDMDLCQNHWCTDPIEDKENPAQEACKDDFTECRYVIEEETHKTKPSPRFFWNLHLFPKIVFHPRQHITGRIIKEESLTEEEAQTLRQQAIGSPTNEDLKPYLNPVMDDSASVYFSGQFRGPDGNLDAVWSISLDIRAEGEGATGYSHDPPAAYRIASFDDWVGLRRALLLPFAEGDEEKDFYANLDTRCPNWIVLDRLIGERAYQIRDDLSVTLPDVLPPETTDPAWRMMRQERVQVDGGWQVRTIIEENRVISDQKALVRNLDFPYGDFFWKRCPDLDDGSFRMTKSQIVRFMARPVPTCNLTALSRASEVYQSLGKRFRRADEDPERNLAARRAQEALNLYDRTKAKERPADLRCPETSLDVLLRRVP